MVMVYGSEKEYLWFMINGSWLMVHDEWLMVFDYIIWQKILYVVKRT